MSDWFKENASGFTGQLLFDEPLSKHTYYRIGGPAKVLVIPKCVADLHWVGEGLRASGLPFFILGAGSNILVSDSGFSGVVVRVNRFCLEMERSEALLRTGGGVAISSLLRRASQEGWGGLEFLTGVPGSVGGAVRMNAGTHLGEVKDRLIRVEAFDLMTRTRLEFTDKLRFEYRKNLFLPDSALVLNAWWRVDQVEPDAVRFVIDETLARRKKTQPIDYPSCGSVFKNPRGGEASLASAWQVVDRLGLRGHRIGDAQFAEKHSNFILNLGSASAADVRALIDLAKTRAWKELGLRLEEEVIYVGT